MLDIDVHKHGFHFRSIKSQDKELFMAIRAETSDVSAFYKAYPGFLDYNWDMILKDEKLRLLLSWTLYSPGTRRCKKGWKTEYSKRLALIMRQPFHRTGDC